MEETEAWTDRMARMIFEGSGLAPADVDIFNPYDGFTLFPSCRAEETSE